MKAFAQVAGDRFVGLFVVNIESEMFGVSFHVNRTAIIETPLWYLHLVEFDIKRWQEQEKVKLGNACLVEHVIEHLDNGGYEERFKYCYEHACQFVSVDEMNSDHWRWLNTRHHDDYLKASGLMHYRTVIDSKI